MTNERLKELLIISIKHLIDIDYAGIPDHALKEDLINDLCISEEEFNELNKELKLDI